MKTYEGMFLFDPAVTTDWDSIQKELDRLLERAGARLIVSGQWDDRRLAYEINGRRRGIYALTYFEADPSKVVSIERDVQLSEAVLRCLILRVEHMTEEQMKEAASSNHAPPVDTKPDDDKPIDDKPGDAGNGEDAPDEDVPVAVADPDGQSKVEDLVVNSNETAADTVSADGADNEEG